jgi:hypothetical protein
MSHAVQAALWPPQAPSLRDFLVSPGFAGAAIVLAAIILLGVVLYTSRRAARRLDKQLEQQDLHHQEVREDRQRAAAIDRGWERLVWLVKTAGMDPAALDADESILGLGPELALALLKGLHRDAKELGDDTLLEAVTVYLTQYGLVLAQQGGPLPDTSLRSNGHPEKPTDAEPGDTPAATTDKPATRDESVPATTAQTRQRK